MAIERLSEKAPLIVPDPCNRRVTHRNWAETKDLLGDVINKINQVIETINLGDIGDTTTIINQIVNNNQFITNNNQFINNYLNNYFSTLYANSIYFTLDADLTLQGGIWTADATVNASWLGIAPSSPTTVIDPAGKWRWTALAGAKGVAIRAAEDGTLYQIMDVECLAPLIRFRVDAGFTTNTKAIEVLDVPKLFVDRLSPLSVDGWSSVWLENPVDDTGTKYRYEGARYDYGEAVLIYNANKPANTEDEPVYAIIQLECP